MKALSIRQPWAYAILHGGKDIENRTQYRKYRGELVIHAPKTLDTFERWPQGEPKPDESVLHRSAILGVVDLVDVVQQSSSPWFDAKFAFGFKLANPRPLPEPIDYSRGTPSFWTVPAAVARAIREQQRRNCAPTCSRYLAVTAANLKNRSLGLSGASDLFPKHIFGGSSKPADCKVCIMWGDEMFETDIVQPKNIFRSRKWGRFFDANRIQPGNRILLEQLNPYLYRVSKE